MFTTVDSIGDHQIATVPRCYMSSIYRLFDIILVILIKFHFTVARVHVLHEARAFSIHDNLNVNVRPAAAEQVLQIWRTNYTWTYTCDLVMS